MLEHLALGRGHLDRMAESRADTAWFASACTDPSVAVIGVCRGAVAMRDGALADLRADFPELDPARTALLGRVGDRVHLALLADDLPDARSLREVGADLSDDDAALATAAVALQQWHDHHTHCPRCGAPTVNALAGWERHCTNDGTAHYPRTDPAVIVRILDDEDRLLLARQQVWPRGRFSIVAGYVEPGETAEHAVAREVLEEVGLEVRDLVYLGSQPWPFPASLMLCYSVRATSTAIRVDGVEIEEAHWYSRDELVDAVRSGQLLLPSAVSIARRAIEDWFGQPLPE